MQHLQIPFGSQISIKSKFTQKYAGFKYQLQIIAALFPPPSIHTNLVQGQSVDVALRFKIFPGEQKIAAQPFVWQGSKVYLVNSSSPTQQYLTSTSKGELKFDKRSLNEQMNKMLFKSATWTLSYASVQKTLSAPSKTPINPFDQIVLKSVYGAYLTVHPVTSACQALPQMDEERSVWNIQLANSLPLPQWLFQRPSFSKFLNDEKAVESVVVERKNLRTNTPDLQQALLVEDILDVSMGFQGNYIKRRPGGQLYVIQPHLSTPSCNIALSQLTYRILEITAHYQKLMGFIKQLEFSKGILVGALCDGLRKIVGQYYQEIVQLDEQAEKGLSLQNMWVQIQNSIKIMRALSELIGAARGLRSGQLLSCLQRLINDTTDGFVLNVYKHIFHKLVELYVEILSKWIYEGVIEDKYGEFMVKIQERSQGEWTNWQERFSLRPEQVPYLLERDQQKILVTGKYLNILKACNREIRCPFIKEIEQNLQYHINRQNFTEPIQRAYDWANQQLLSLVFGECKLMKVLTSLKGYYFLQFGDLFVHFLDAAEDDLITQKKAKLDGKNRTFSVQKLQSLFELTVRISSANNDYCKQQISCRLDTMTVFEQVHRIKTLESEAFEFDFSQKPFIKKDSKYVDYVTLDYKCDFPLNLILNKKSISKYQAIFRLMLWCTFLERQISSCWLMLQTMKEMGDMDCFKNAYSLNHRILTFLKRLIYYFSQEVIEQNWFKLSADLKKAQNFEEIIQFHDQFLNNCLKESLLTSAKLLPLLTSDIGSTINNYIQLKNYLLKVEEEYNTIKQNKPTDPSQLQEYRRYVKSAINDFIEEESYLQFLSKSSKSFQEGLNSFIHELTIKTKKEQSHLLRLSQMLQQQNFTSKRGKFYYS